VSGEAGTETGTTAEGDEQRFVTLGRISGVHGVQGWVRVHSDTSPRENIVNYSPWFLVRRGRRETWKLKSGRGHGKTVLAKLEGCNDRNAAEELVGALISVPRAALPDTSLPGEYYWADLVGLAVKTTDDVDLGRIDHLFETGSNDVMVVQGDRERLVPYIWKQVVLEVDLKAGEMLVDWDPEF
jgi:16S rRNA processing protein RimM